MAGSYTQFGENEVVDGGVVFGGVKLRPGSLFRFKHTRFDICFWRTLLRLKLFLQWGQVYRRWGSKMKLSPFQQA